MDFEMDRPRGRSARHAIVIIKNVQEGCFIVEKMEFIEPSDVENAIEVFRKLRRLSIRLEPDSSQSISK
eukprot:3127244-Karenia_brevis.AAC.1